MKIQTVDTTGKPDWCPALPLCEVWDGDEKPENCIRDYVFWTNNKGYPFGTEDVGHYEHAEPIPAPEPKPRSLVWMWADEWDDESTCDHHIYNYASCLGINCIPARYENGELEPAPTVAEAKRRKEAGE